MSNKLTPYRLFMAVRMHLGIVWRDFHGVTIGWKTAWEVSSGIWLKD
jgi:hypothetical protein